MIFASTDWLYTEQHPVRNTVGTLTVHQLNYYMSPMSPLPFSFSREIAKSDGFSRQMVDPYASESVNSFIKRITVDVGTE